MLDAPIDGWYGWIGLSIVSAIVLGLILALPAARAPDADRVADAIEDVATSQYSAVTDVDLAAEAVRLDPRRVSLRRDGVVAHATLDVGSATPVGRGELRAVLDGRRPAAVFDSRGAFRRALTAARNATGDWWTGTEHLTIRRVSWGRVSATLVG